MRLRKSHKIAVAHLCFADIASLLHIVRLNLDNIGSDAAYSDVQNLLAADTFFEDILFNINRLMSEFFLADSSVKECVQCMDQPDSEC